MLRRVVLVVLVVLLGGQLATRADDVPDDVRDLYQEALQREASGDLKKAYSILSKARNKDPLSVDFWELYVRVWRGLDKKEDVLWDKIVGKLEKANAKSPVFELLRARLAEDTAGRMKHLRGAVAKDPEAVRPQLLLAKAVLADGDDIEAEEILERLLEKHPGNEEALVVRGELDLDADRALSALSFAEEQLEAHPLPGLLDLKARALLAASATNPERLEPALEAAREAVAARADPRYTRTLVEILDRKGDLEEAVKVLDEAYAATKASVLAVKLGELAFRKGDYEKALEGLGADAQPSTSVLKGIAVANGRLGNLEGMRRAAQRLAKRLAETDPLWIAWREFWAREPEAALAAIAGGDAAEAAYLKAWANAYLGKVEAVKPLCDDNARAGDRDAEEWLMPLVTARVFQKLGSKAGSATKAIREAEIAAAKAGTPSATVDEDEPPMHAKSVGYMDRAVRYRRSLCGTWFAPQSGQFNVTFQERDGGGFVMLVGLQGEADCALEPTRSFWFNPQEVDAQSGEAIARALGGIMNAPGNQQWPQLEAAFAAGAAALVDEDWAKAKESFAKAAEGEPDWGRAKLFGAVAGLLGGGDAATAAQEAAAAIALLPDDYDGQRLLVLLQVLAGQDPKATAKQVADAQEAHAVRRVDAL